MSSQSNWTWLRRDVIEAIHDAQLVEHGGPPGTHSPELVDSALARAHTLADDVAGADAIDAGAMYALAIAHYHPFIDGNKRVAWVAMRVFLAMNGVTLTYVRAEAVGEMLALAAGQRTDETFTAWVRVHATR